MEIIPFVNYRSYLNAQLNTVKRRGIGPYFSDAEITNISKWLTDRKLQPKSIICHGARCGSEIDSFLKIYPEARAIGTDLFPKRGKASHWNTQSEVIKHDFMEQRKDWIGAFDVIYSNSLDHAYDPFRCISTWLDQLSANGKLFVQWTVSHKYTNGGDCFGASLDEYIMLFMQLGHVEDVISTLYAPARRVTDCFTIVSRKRTRRENRRCRQ